MTVYYVNPGDFTDIKKYRGSERNITLPSGKTITNFLAVPDGSNDVWPQGITTPIAPTPFHDKVEVITFTGAAVDITFTSNHWSLNRVFNSVLADLRRELATRTVLGITFNGDDYPTDEKAKEIYDIYKGTDSAVTLVLLDGNTTKLLNKNQFQNLIKEIADYEKGFIDNAKVHFDAVIALNAIPNQAGLEGYDVTIGWPANPAPPPAPVGPIFYDVLP